MRAHVVPGGDPPSQGARTARRRFSVGAMLVAISVAVVQVVGSYWTARPTFDHGGDWAFVLVLVGPAALVFCYRWPRTVLLITAGAALFYFGVVGYGPIVLAGLVAAYGAVVAGHRILVWCAAGVSILGTLVVVAIEDGGWPTGDVLAHAAVFVAITVAVLAVGELVRARRARAEQVRVAQEETRRRAVSEERLRLVQELHDVLGHSVSLINVQAGAALHILDRDPEGARVALRAIRQVSGEVMSEVRSMLEIMRDGGAAPRMPTAGLAQLPALIDQCRTGGLQVEVVSHGDPIPLSPSVDFAALRIVQESLTNVIRHAHVDHALLTLDYGDDELRIGVRNGPGPHTGNVPTPSDPIEAGTGIRSMIMRAESVGGHVEVARLEQGGFMVTATLPAIVELS